MGIVLYGYLTGKQSTGRQVDTLTDFSVMGNNYTGIDEGAEADRTFRADITLCQDLDPIRKGHRIFDKSRRVNERGKAEALFLQPPEDIQAYGIVSDASHRIDCSFDAVCPDFGEFFRSAQNLYTGNQCTRGDAVIDDAADFPTQQPQQ